ncbi:60S ribosomal protein L6 [Octopus sinensis]|uniref:Large ribosomal subunit protein eL6 n=1 Tax=Octopus sinensis TaxID=2607531 RepID=A0A6P7TM10_9MOLL|nr:60S ribosomal protein L6 [Octopus sinensis]
MVIGRTTGNVMTCFAVFVDVLVLETVITMLFIFSNSSFIMEGTEKKKPETKAAVAKKASTKRRPRNPVISSSGLRRFSRSRVYKRRRIFIKKEQPKTKAAKKVKPAKYVVKPIGGEKNGETRKVRVKRLPRHIPTQEGRKRQSKHRKPFSKHKRNLRKSIVPGTVLILLAGRHKGKRVVFLKQLSSGLLLVTGPFAMNGCPLRRVNQIYAIATTARANVSKVKIPPRINDNYFKRKAKKTNKHKEVELFETEKKEYTLTKERKEDQLEVDKQVIDSIKRHKERKQLKGYLQSMFALKNKMYPHKMLF